MVLVNYGTKNIFDRQDLVNVHTSHTHQTVLDEYATLAILDRQDLAKV